MKRSKEEMSKDSSQVYFESPTITKESKTLIHDPAQTDETRSPQGN